MSVIRYFKREFSKAKREVKQIDGRNAKLQYIWDYYKLWIIGFAAITGLIIYFIVVRLTTPDDNWFYITVANTQADAGNRSGIRSDFISYAGFDTKEKNVYFNDNCYFDPFSDRPNDYYTYFVAYVEAGTLDLIAMEKDDLEKLGERGWLLDLTRPEASAVMEKYADRLIYAVPKDETYSTEPVPIGIDVSDSKIVKKYHIYKDSCALGLSSNCPHMDAVLTFLDFILEDE